MATVKTKELVKMAKAVQAGLAEKALVPGMTRIQFTGQDIVTYNGSICVHFPMDTGFKCSVSASEFIRIVSRIKNEDTELEFDDKAGKFKLKSGRVKADFSTEAVNDLDTIIKKIRDEIPTDPDDWIELSAKFVKGIQWTTPSASRNKQKGAACLLHCREKYLMCADNTKLAMYFMETPGIFMVDAMEITSLINTGASWCFFTDTWVHFLSEDNIVTSIRKRAGEFQYDKFEALLKTFPKDAERIDIPKELKNAIDTTSTFSEEDGKITVEISKGSMKCMGKSLHGTAEYDIDFQYEGSTFEFPINLAWISHVLDKTEDMLVDTDSKRVQFNVGDFWYLVSMKRRT